MKKTMLATAAVTSIALLSGTQAEAKQWWALTATAECVASPWSPDTINKTMRSGNVLAAPPKLDVFRDDAGQIRMVLVTLKFKGEDGTTMMMTPSRETCISARDSAVTNGILTPSKELQ